MPRGNQNVLYHTLAACPWKDANQAPNEDCYKEDTWLFSLKKFDYQVWKSMMFSVSITVAPKEFRHF